MNNDKIAGGAGNDYLDGGENAGEDSYIRCCPKLVVQRDRPSWGETNRDVDDNGSLVI